MSAWYRKKPVVIEAVHFLGDNMLEVREFTQSQAYATTEQRMLIPTLEGQMIVVPDDWVIRGVQGEFYPVSPRVFEATYEPVSEVPA